MARQRSSTFGPVLVGLAIAFATWWVARGYYLRPNYEVDLYDVEASQELDSLRARYGPDRNSENFEEWISATSSRIDGMACFSTSEPITTR